MITRCEKSTGYAKVSLVWFTAFFCVMLLLSAHFAFAQGTGASVPEPAPTDAVKVSGKTLTVTGRADLKQGPLAARYAALLKGYGQLLRYGLKNGLFPGSWGAENNGFRLYRIDSSHPGSDVLSWIARSKVVKEKTAKKEKVLVLESPTVGTLASARPFLRAMTTQDVDLDGLSDVIAVGYDGRIYVLQSPSDDEGKLKARSESFGLLELAVGPGFERIRAVLPQEIRAVENVGDSQIRVVVNFEILEAVNGELLGRQEEQREILLSLSDTEKRIRFTINEPPDFARMFDKTVEIRGNTISEQLLEDVAIRHNGNLAWESPSGIGIRALQFNLARELTPGWNSIRLTARDQEGYSQMRELWIQGPPRTTPKKTSKKRAVIVALDSRLKEKQVRKALNEAGFQDAWITILEGEDVTGESLLSSIQQPLGASELFLYCEATSLPGALVEGKSLRFADREVTPSELAQAIEAAGYEKSVGLFHTEIPPARQNQFTIYDLWRDTSAFLDRMGDAGRLMVANVERPTDGIRSQRKKSRARLLTALRDENGSDLERLLDLRTPDQTVFRGWMHGGPLLQAQ